MPIPRSVPRFNKSPKKEVHTERESQRDSLHVRNKTSWEGVHDWYDSIVGQEGHYYHQHVILPAISRLFSLNNDPNKGSKGTEGKSCDLRVLDVACGQGVLSRAIHPSIPYVGIDISQGLIRAAKQHIKPSSLRQFYVGDATKELPIPLDAQFSHAACILALQNIDDPKAVFKNVFKRLKNGGEFLIVLNHPCFRIPRHSQWSFDEKTKSQVRQIRGYMSPQSIPIAMRPGKNEAESTTSFHHPLHFYFSALHEAGFVVSTLEEWCSDKTSSGPAARWENRARKEFPLFLAIVAKKI